jgi:hypothetical protein
MIPLVGEVHYNTVTFGEDIERFFTEALDVMCVMGARKSEWQHNPKAVESFRKARETQSA